MIELTSHPKQAAVGIAAGVAVIATLLYVFWPVGVVIGAVAGVLLVAVVGRDMQAASATVVSTGTDSLEVVPSQSSIDDEVRADLIRLHAELGEEYADFARAAKLVVSTQYASIARLQRALDVPYVRAKHVVQVLEEQRFVGPARGARPRDVLLGTEHLERLSRLLDEALVAPQTATAPEPTRTAEPVAPAVVTLQAATA